MTDDAFAVIEVHIPFRDREVWMDRIEKLCKGKHHWWQFWRRSGCTFYVMTCYPLGNLEDE